MQIWGRNPDNFRTIAREIADGTIARELGLPDGVNFVGIDINMGCPAKSEVQGGTCAALIKRENWDRAKEIIDAVKDGVMGRLPLSVKTRVGFNEVDMNWLSFLLVQNLDMLTVHGRTRKQMSKVPADWELIGTARGLRDRMGVKTRIVGNGDVMSRIEGEKLARQYKLDGIMIGRGIFHDPYIFAPTSHLEDRPIETIERRLDGLSTEEKIELFRCHVTLFAETWQHSERPIHTLNKFCKVYIQGFDGAKELREKLMACTSTQDLLGFLTILAK